MNIRTLHVDGFGIWSNLRIEQIPPGITVFYGQNEAGKTTLMQFLRTMFYGLPPERRARYLPPVHGGAPGGWLEVLDRRQSLSLAWHDDGRPDQTTRPLLHNAAGNVLPAAQLDELLAGVDQAMYRNVFAFGLREIQELDSLGDAAAADLLYKLATGIDRVSLVDVRRELTAARERLIAPAGQASRVAQLVSQRDRLHEQQAQLQHTVRESGQWIAERRRLADEQSRGERDAAELDRQTEWLEQAESLRSAWDHRHEIDVELRKLGDLPKVQPADVEQLDALVAKLEHYQQRQSTLRKQWGGMRSDAARLSIRRKLWKQSARITALAEQTAWLRGLVDEINSRSDEVKDLSQRLASQREALGMDPRTDHIEPIEQAALAKLAPVRRGLRAARQRLREAREKVEHADHHHKRSTESLAAGLKGRDTKDLTGAIERAGQNVSLLRQRTQLDERIDQMTRKHDDITEDIKHLASEHVLSPQTLVGLGVAVVVGITLVLSGLILPTSFLGSASWGLIAVGLMAGGGGAAGKVLLERTASFQWEEAERQAELLATQIEQAQQQRTALDAQLPKGAGPMLQRLATAEKEHASLEELMPHEARRQSSQQDSTAAREQLERAKVAYAAAQKRWRHALEEAGLPADSEPRHAPRLAAQREALAELTERLTRRRRDLDDRRRDLAAITARVTQAAVDADIQTPSSDPVANIDLLRRALVEVEGRVAERRQLRRKLLHLRHRLRHVAKRTEQVRVERRRLWDRVGVIDDAALRAQAELRKKILALQTDRAEVERLLIAALPADTDLTRLDRWFEQNSADAVRKRLAQQRTQRQQLREQLQQLAEQRGRLAERIAAVQTDRTAGRLALDIAAIEQQLDETIERWQVLTVAARELDNVRRQYETERQPEALRVASRWLASLTEGHYRRVWTMLDRDELRVDDASGQSLSVESLSSGTREQVFLSLRLALVTALAERGASLPLVLDDILVNFDAPRARAAAAALVEFSAMGHQVLMFTCHEHLAEMFRQLEAPVVALPDRESRVGGCRIVIGEVKTIEPVLPAPVIMPEVRIEPKPRQAPPRRRRLPRAEPEPIQTVAEVIPLELEPEPVFVRAEPIEPEPVVIPPAPVAHAEPFQIRRPFDLFTGTTWHEPVQGDVEEPAELQHRPAAPASHGSNAPFYKVCNGWPDWY
ncbi:MAG: AAA family ATPase [Planctomycetes bacterium]|nr:AAA family ATPase [Planctomycetota bacterium]